MKGMTNDEANPNDPMTKGATRERPLFGFVIPSPAPPKPRGEGGDH